MKPIKPFEPTMEDLRALWMGAGYSKLVEEVDAAEPELAKRQDVEHKKFRDRSAQVAHRRDAKTFGKRGVKK